MNKYIKYFLCLSAASLAFAACQEEYEKPSVGEEDLDGCYGVYFPEQTDAVALTLDPAEATVATITVLRTNTNDAITVPVELSDTSGFFKADSVVFEAGEAETTFKVQFDGISIGVNYLASFEIKDPLYASRYAEGATSIDLTVIREKWNSLGWGTWYENGYFEFDAPEDVEIFQNDNDSTSYRIAMTNKKGAALYSDGQDTYFKFKLLLPGDKINEDESNELKITKTGLVTFDIFSTGIYNPNYPSAPIWFVHPVSFSSLSGTESNYAWNKVLQYQDNGKPAGIQFAPYYYINGVGGWNYTQYDDIIQVVFPGCTLVDYTVEAEAGESVDGELPVYFTLGADVDSVAYAVYEGTVSTAARERYVASISAGTETNAKTLGDADAVSVSCDASGVYTLIAVAFDAEKKAQSSGYVQFNYVAKGDEETYAVDVKAGLELTSRYEAQGYTKLNSTSFYIYGSGLESVKYGLYKTSALADVENLASLFDEEEAVSDSILNLVNTTGYADVITGLAPLTDYTLVVLGNNGYLSKAVTAQVTTEGLANIELCKGDYTYAQFFDGTDEGLTLYRNPNYENTYVIPEWGYGVDFTFTYDPSTGKVKVPAQFIGYTHASYGKVYVGELKDVVSEKSSAYQDIESNYDADSTKFNFAVCYFVSAGVFGAGWEEFALEKAVTFSSVPKSAAKPYAVKMGVAHRELPAVSLKLDKKPVSFETAGLKVQCNIERGGSVAVDAKPIKKSDRVWNQVTSFLYL